MNEMRLWSKILVVESCWEWIGAINSNGYGSVRVGGSSKNAHRVMYEQRRGAIPERTTLDHLCRNRRCVNPDHLEPVTDRENVMRGLSGPALNAKRLVCKRGHSFSGDNLHIYRYADGSVERQCRACARIRRGVKSPRLHALAERRTT